MAYESVTGEPLARDPKTNARLASDVVLQVLEQTRAVVKENPAVSVEDAIRATLGLTTAATAPSVPNAVVTEEMLELLQTLTSTVQRQTEVIEALQAEQAAMREQLQALPQPQEAQQAEPADHDLVADLERRNAYLAGELKRRDAEPAPRQSWWPWRKS